MLTPAPHLRLRIAADTKPEPTVSGSRSLSAQPALRLVHRKPTYDEISARLHAATRQAEQLARQLQRALGESVWTLASVIETRDAYTAGHSQRVAWLARLTGEALELGGHDLQTLEWAGALHDVGKLGVAERILSKAGPLTDVEREQIQQHPRLGCAILRPMTGLAEVLDAVLHHHEDHDGNGYPDGLAGDEIPLFARILHVADIFDALLSDRPYRRGLAFDAAVSELENGAGTKTDPEITRVFLDALRDVRTRQPELFERQFRGAYAGAP